MSDGTSDRVAVAHFLRFHPRASDSPKLLLSRLATQDLGSASRLSSMRLNREDLSAAAERARREASADVAIVVAIREEADASAAERAIAMCNGGLMALDGAQALGMAWSMRPQTVEEDFDYGREIGLGIKQWMKVEKLRFGSGSNDTDNLKDNGIVTGYFAAAAEDPPHPPIPEERVRSSQSPPTPVKRGLPSQRPRHPPRGRS